MKKRGPLLAAFCIPLLITLIICVNREIYPFGDQCMLHIDMYHQYCPFFTEQTGQGNCCRLQYGERLCAG